jgi:phospholipase C
MKYRALFGCLTAAFAVITAGALAEDHDRDRDDHRIRTATPIKHLVVIFQENISFDHYFGTYPHAQNNPGETPFHARPHTPTSINSLLTPLDTTNHFVPLVGVDLIHSNPNAVATNPVAPNNSKMNGADAANPFRLSPAQALTADQGHNDSPEQSAYNNGHMDGFPAWVGTAGPPPSAPPATVATKGLVMGYYDGNTVTALWNYAQHFAVNDNSYVTQFGPSSPGAINLISGQTNGFSAFTNVVSAGASLHATHEVPDGDGNYTLIGDGDPMGDVCSNPAIDQVTMAGRNIGDLLNARGITWGWFEGGFDLTIVNPAQPPLNPTTTTGCHRTTVPAAPGTPAFTSTDYIPHHQPFQYYASTSNPMHRRPSSVQAIGHSLIPHTSMPEPANHQYDSHDFFDALAAHNLPAVSFLKAPAFQDGHAGYSDPLDEQTFLVKVINALQKSEEWESTAVIIAYDDSDGWYDHQMPPIVNPSFVGTFPAIPPLTRPVDTLNGPALCNHGFQQGTSTPATPLLGTAGMSVQGRCGYGTRSPLLVISPFAKVNHVDHTLTDQTSILKFIEDNWLAGERIQPGGSFDTIAGTIEHMFDFDRHEEGEARKVFLDPATGAVVRVVADDDEH